MSNVSTIAPNPSGSPASRVPAPLLGLIALCAALAWMARFVQDDAFIAFRYAANLAHGHGFVYNPGERIEGYTDFLWTLILALPARLGIDLVQFSYVFGLSLFVLTLWATWHVARLLSSRQTVAYVAVALLGTNYSFLGYATGGLETQLQALMYALTLMLYLGGPSGRIDGPMTSGIQRGPSAITRERLRQLATSLTAAAAVLTRLDSVLLVGPVILADLMGDWNRRTQDRSELGPLTTGVLRRVAPGGLLVLAWLGWKLWYYGDLLPNTFYAKAARHTPLPRGVWYVSLFLGLYLLAATLLIYLFHLRALWRERARLTFFAINIPPLLWMLYLVKVGGDFMEFRMMVPISPVLYIVSAWVIVEQIKQVSVRWACVGAMITASVLHATTFSGSRLSRGIESFPELKQHVASVQGTSATATALPDWASVGRKLGTLFPRHDVLTAVAPGGAIPYYSELPTIDMLGLNDRWVARHGAFLSDRPGHQKIATVAYLCSRNVALIIGHPQIHPAGEPPRAAYSVAELAPLFQLRGFPDPQNIPQTAQVLEIPLETPGAAPPHQATAGNPVRPPFVTTLYLTQSNVVDAVIAQAGLRVVPIRR